MQAYRAVTDSSGVDCAAVLVVTGHYSDGKGGQQRRTDTICIGAGADDVVVEVAGGVIKHIVPLFSSTAGVQVARSRATSCDVGPMVPAAAVLYEGDVMERTRNGAARSPRVLLRPGACYSYQFAVRV